MKLAEQFLFLYQSSQFVITTRLHAALPSLALEVPVMYITDAGAANYDPSRLTGLMELTNHVTESEFLDSVEGLNFETPPSNPGSYDHESERRSIHIFDSLYYANQKMAEELSQLNTVRVSIRKLLGNIRRKIKSL